MAAPSVPKPADYFALTRIFVVPSVWEEPFGRAAAEAMIDAIAPLVSARGALPNVIGGHFSANERYSEAVSRQKHLDYFTSLGAWRATDCRRLDTEVLARMRSTGDTRSKSAASLCVYGA